MLELANRLRDQAEYLYREDQRRIGVNTYMDMMRAATIIEKLQAMREAEAAMLRTMQVNDERESDEWGYDPDDESGDSFEKHMQKHTESMHG